MKMKSSTIVKSVLVGTPVFLAGCGCAITPAPVVTPVVAADGVPVVTAYQPGYHYSPFYHGFVPIFIPMGGLGYGNTYQTFYNRVPAAERSRYSYATPTSSGRASAAPIRTSSASTTVTPTRSASTVSPSSSAGKTTAAPASSTVRGIAGGTALGHGSSAS